MKYFNDIPEVEKCDIVIGIPSFNNADTIGFVASQSAKGIIDLGLKGTLVNSDGGSTDGTVNAFLNVDTFGVPKYSLVYKGIPGKGSAIRALFEFAHKAEAKVFVMLDSDLRSVAPWWVERLAKPILEGRTNYVTPMYVRYKYDGTITNNICYPLVSVLYGKKVRQPIGGDFGVGKELIDIYVSKDVWETNIAKFGIDIWMTVTAILESNKKPLQSALGAKIHDVKDPGKHLEGMFIQVVQTLFELIANDVERLKEVKEIESVEIYGEQLDVEVEEIKIDLPGLKKRAKETLLEKGKPEYLNSSIVEKVLGKGTLSASEWVETVYDSINEYKKKRDPMVVSKLLPFYFARVAGFVEETKDISTSEAEKHIEDQLRTFSEKKYKIF